MSEPPGSDPAPGGESPLSVEPRNRWFPKMSLKLIAFVVLGALAGLAYNRFIGCRTGACPITANPYISTIYGAVLGFLISGGFR